MKNRYAAVKADGEKIHAMVKENLEYFKATEDSEDWRRYVDYLDDLVLDGFFSCVECSLRYLLENMDKVKATPPLLMAKFELEVNNMAGACCIIVNGSTTFSIQVHV